MYAIEGKTDRMTALLNVFGSESVCVYFYTFRSVYVCVCIKNRADYHISLSPFLSIYRIKTQFTCGCHRVYHASAICAKNAQEFLQKDLLSKKNNS